MRVVLATGNAGKLRELAALLRSTELMLESLAQLGIASPEETGTTFLENALLKARHAAREAQRPAIAEDSGIEVDALGGAPGVRSARYAGDGASDDANLDKLLLAIADIPDPQRTARYRCVAVFVRDHDDPSPLIAEGTWEGRIIGERRGSGGFGYDPIFVPLGMDQTSAEIDAAAKNSLSHRGKALRALVAQLAQARIGAGAAPGDGADGASHPAAPSR